jgi:hypothetical protein
MDDAQATLFCEAGLAHAVRVWTEDPVLAGNLANCLDRMFESSLPIEESGSGGGDMQKGFETLEVRLLACELLRKTNKLFRQWDGEWADLDADVRLGGGRGWGGVPGSGRVPSTHLTLLRTPTTFARPFCHRTRSRH